jgi:lipopolysaccharide transport system ATP-binding protein
VNFYLRRIFERMTDIAIEFENVSKKFKRGEKFDSIRDLVPAIAKRLTARRNQSPYKLEDREFWALKDVSFQMKKGGTLGIIGPNGAGKSTILKILSGILRPTVGHYKVNGRIGALIEVGAGFHQDLTGRENIFLNGAILGMKPGEVSAKLGDIIEFSGLKDFIDTPVKRYSSGMYARLGFSVAVHVNPDILLVDEVLSVGDMAFQAKCQKKMQEIAQGGATIIFITHNIPALAGLCNETIVLNQGKVVQKSPTTEAINTYFEVANSLTTVTPETALVLKRLHIGDASGKPSRTFRTGEPFRIEVDFIAQQEIHQLAVGVWLRGPNGQQVFNISTQRMHIDPISMEPGHSCRARFDMNANLCSGSYPIGIVAKRYDLDTPYFIAEPAGVIEIAGIDNSEGTAWLSPSCALELNNESPQENSL